MDYENMYEPIDEPYDSGVFYDSDDICDDSGVLLDAPINNLIKEWDGDMKYEENGGHHAIKHKNTNDKRESKKNIHVASKNTKKTKKLIKNKGVSHHHDMINKMYQSDNEQNYNEILSLSTGMYESDGDKSTSHHSTITRNRQLDRQFKAIEAEKLELTKKIIELQTCNNNLKSINYKQEHDCQKLEQEVKSLKAANRTQEKKILEIEKNKNYENCEKYMSDDQTNKDLLERLRVLSDRLTLTSIRGDTLHNDNERLKKDIAHMKKTHPDVNVNVNDDNTTRIRQRNHYHADDRHRVDELLSKISESEQLIKSLQQSLRNQRKGFLSEITSLRHIIHQYEKDAARSVDNDGYSDHDKISVDPDMYLDGTCTNGRYSNKVVLKAIVKEKR